MTLGLLGDFGLHLVGTLVEVPQRIALRLTSGFLSFAADTRSREIRTA